MKRKLTVFLLTALALVLTGCQLARPEAESGGTEDHPDQFIGFYVVRYDSMDAANGFYSSPYLTEYGTETLETEYGSFDLPRSILIAEYDGETHDYTFPGLEGHSLFAVTKEEDGAPCTSIISNMAECTSSLYSSDTSQTCELEGTLFIGPPEDAAEDWDAYTSGWLWEFYRVYQTKDGVVYLDGSGNSTSGGGGWTFSEEAASTRTVDGESTTETVKATVHVEVAERLEKLVVSQFGADNVLLRTDEVTLESELPEFTCGGDAAWVLVEEYFTDGTVKRTAYTLPTPGEEAISHPLVLLDEKGMGMAVTLTIQ